MRAPFERIETKEGLAYYQATAFTQTGLVRHAFSTRLGGASQGGQLNLGRNTPDDQAQVLENYRRFCHATGLCSHRMVLSQQVHGDHIAAVGEADAGRGLYAPGLSGVDGLMTDVPGLALATFYADCTPLLLLDPVRRVVASVHSGWRGTVQRIGAKAVAAMQAQYGCDPADILVAIGPAIGPCHFEVDADVRDLFVATFGDACLSHIVTKGAKFYIDTHAINVTELCRAGIDRAHISISGLCTVCHVEEFFSYRAEGAKAGRLCAAIALQ